MTEEKYICMNLQQVKKSLGTPLYLQTLHNPPVLQMFINNLIYIFAIYIGIPDRFRVNSEHRAFCTTIQTAGSIYPHPAPAGKTQFLATLLGIIAQPLRTKALATFTAINPQVCAKKDMVLVIGHA